MREPLVITQIVPEVVMIDISRMQHGLGSRVMTTQLAASQESQSAPHVVGIIFLLDLYVL